MKSTKRKGGVVVAALSVGMKQVADKEVHFAFSELTHQYSASFMCSARTD